MSDEDKILILLSVLFILVMSFLFLQPQSKQEEIENVPDVQDSQGIVVLYNPVFACQDLCVERESDLDDVETTTDKLIYCTCQNGYKRLIGKAP